ncbi:MAG: cyclic nucleotide-binding domain-containing protein [Candidatus Wallbacteria bacterium]|nr:cyclic nucleotide-binding domain-containing protein [Candidatus Wallbacteria bacterium]
MNSGESRGEGLLQSKPRRKPGVELEERGQAGGAATLRDPATGVALGLERTERWLWSELDGTRTVRELVDRGLMAAEPVGPTELGATLARFARAGFVEGARRAAPPASRLALGLALPRLGPWARRAVGAAAAILAIAPMAGFVPLLAALRDNGLALVAPGGSPLWAAAAAWACVWYRGVCQALAAAACGFRLPRAGVDLRAGLPLPYLELSELGLADRKHQVLVSLTGLLSPLALASAGCSAAWLGVGGMDTAMAGPLAAVALLTVIFDASPLFEGNGYRLYRAAFDRELVRDQALAFFARKLLVQLLGDRPSSEEEKRLFRYGVASVAWVLVAMKLAASAFRASAVPLVLAIFDTGSRPVQALLLGLLVASASLLGYALVRVLAVPLALFGEHVRRDAIARLVVPAAVLASAAGTLWDTPNGQVLLQGLFATLLVLVWNRHRAVWSGMPMLLGMDLLVLFLGLRAIFIVPTALVEATAPAFGVELVFGRQLGLEWSGVLLLAAAPFYFRQAAGASPRKRDRFAPAAAAAVLMTMAAPAMSAGRSIESLCTYTGVVAAVTAMAQLMLVDGASPIGRAWRLLFTAFVAMAAAATVELHAAPGSLGRLATLPLWTASLLPVAAAVFVARTVLSGPFRARPRDRRRASADPREACRSASGHLFGTCTDLAREVLGERRSQAVLGESLWTDAEDPRHALREGYAMRLAALERHGGHAFRAAVEHAATRGLYWLEWQVANREIFFTPLEEPAEDLERLLEEIPFFALLGAGQRAELATAMTREWYDAGSRILHQGDLGDRFYVVRSGELAVRRLDPGGIDRRVARLVAGDCFGELALLASSTRTASVDAVTDVELLSLGRDEFLEVFPESAAEREAVVSVIRHGGFLRRVPLFSQLPPVVLSRLAAKLESRPLDPALPAEEFGGKAGAASVLLVREGRARVEPANGEAMELGEGQAWGEWTLAGEALPAARITALEPGTALALRPDELRKALDAYLATVASLQELASPRGIA